MSTDPLHRAEQRQAFRFNRQISRADAPALCAETEARIVNMTRLRVTALAESMIEVDYIERRGALSVYRGAGVELDNLTDHLSRLRGMIT